MALGGPSDFGPYISRPIAGRLSCNRQRRRDSFYEVFLL